MIKISRLADYAVVILAVFAQSEEGKLLNASYVSVQTHLPEPTVSKVLKLLAKDGVLTSVRGAAGGYKLSCPVDQIDMAHVIRAVDGPIALTACVDQSEQGCDFEGHCSVKGRWDDVNTAITQALENVSLADMVRPAIKKNPKNNHIEAA